jgi:multidrug efflux pump subunit AcrB
MNIGEYSIEKRTVVLVLTAVAAIGGMQAYENLGRLEDPEFTIKEAIVTTPYPGASAEEVDREVTSVLDREIQRMGQIKRLESRSLRGRSIIQVVIQDKFRKADLQQIWDELRRKVQAAQAYLPPGAGPSDVNDDFGDVYGVYVGITGEGYSYSELKNFVNLLRREFVLVEGVKRVELFGNQPEAVYVEMKRDRMAALGISEEQIFRSLGARNMAVDGGRARVGSLYPAVEPSGLFTSERQFEELLISEPGAPELIYLGNVADVERGYLEPPSTLLRMSYRTVRRDGRLLSREEIDALPEDVDWGDPAFEVDSLLGQHAIGLAVSTVEGGNVVRMGEALTRRLEELQPLLPIGIEATVIALQSEAVTKSINGFMVNLIEAIVIVVVVLLLFMGLRAGLLIGFILFLTISASFIVMHAQGILLERISLGALIIALGMLVDNAIVVTEGMQLRIERGDDPREAARDVVGQNQWPLLGATFVAVIAFASIGLSDHSTGEYTRSLFFVLLISLLMSWLTAVTVTPLLCTMLFRPKPQKQGGDGDPYAGGLFRAYRGLLEFTIRARYATIAVVFALFGLSVYGFTLLPPGFFPYSTRPQYMLDIWLPQDTHIREVERSAAELEQFVMSIDNTKSIANHVGSGGLRFLLVYSPEQPNPAYAQFLVNVYDYRNIQDDMASIEAWAALHLPDALVFGKPFKLGPGVGGNIQLRLSGPDRGVLRDLGHEATAFLKADPQVKYVRWDWKEPVPLVRPVLARAQARRNGIERPQIADRLQASFEGLQVGLYREGTRDDEDRLLPIIYRPPLLERVDVANLNDVQVQSQAANRSIPLRQVVSEFQTVSSSGAIAAPP